MKNIDKKRKRVLTFWLSMAITFFLAVCTALILDKFGFNFFDIFLPSKI